LRGREVDAEVIFFNKVDIEKAPFSQEERREGTLDIVGCQLTMKRTWRRFCLIGCIS
jgi:hypothetical protein